MIGVGGIFRVKNILWVVDGIFCYGLNLLIVLLGVGKFWLCVVFVGVWINGKDEFMGGKLFGFEELCDCYILIVGID